MTTVTIQNHLSEGKSVRENRDRINKTITPLEPNSRIKEFGLGEIIESPTRPGIGCIASWIDEGGKQLGISKIGPARRGIFTRVAKRLKDYGLNIDEGFSTKMENAFTTTLIISGPREKLTQLYQEIIDHPNEEPSGEAPIKQNILDKMLFIAKNRPGIVADISQCLNEANINLATMAIKTKEISDPTNPGQTMTIGIVHTTIEMTSEDAIQKFEERIRKEAPDYSKWHVEIEGKNGKKLLNRCYLSEANFN